MATNKSRNLYVPSYDLTNIRHFRDNKHLWNKIQRLKTNEGLKFLSNFHNSYPSKAALTLNDLHDTTCMIQIV